MRQGNNNRRMRGRNNQNGHRSKQQPNWRQTFDSNGPDVRIRGNAFQVYEKYQNLARDANSAGDRVAAENYYQHAEHYYRILMADQSARERHQKQLAEAREAEEGVSEEEQAAPGPDENGPESGAAEAREETGDETGGRRRPRRRHRDAEPLPGEGEQPDLAPAAAAEDPPAEEEAPKPRRRPRARKTETAEDAGQPEMEDAPA